jgi:hypothetical protein
VVLAKLGGSTQQEDMGALRRQRIVNEYDGDGSGEYEDGGGEARHRHRREPMRCWPSKPGVELVSMGIVYEGTEMTGHACTEEGAQLKAILNISARC